MSEKPPAYFRRTLSGLVPAGKDEEERLRKIKVGAVVQCEITQPRNIRFHRRFFGMLNVVYLACDQWSDIRELLIDLKFRVGLVDQHRVIDHRTGEILAVITVPRSISFAAMDDEAFREFFDRCVRVICEDMVPGLDDSVLRDEVLRAVG